MPIYEYHCKKCNYQFEQLQKITDDVLVICPKCGQNSLQKMVSQTSFTLKGTGWYVTDFKDKKKDSASEKKVVATDKKIENKKTDAKTEVKPEVKTSKTSDKAGDKK